MVKRLAFLLLCLLMVGAAEAGQGGRPGQPVYVVPPPPPPPPSMRYPPPPPPMRRDMGMLSVTNRDWSDYTIIVRRGQDDMFIVRGRQRGGTVVPAGSTVAIPLPKENYKMVGESGKQVRIRINERETTAIVLTPFGRPGATGLRADVGNRGKMRSVVLFDEPRGRIRVISEAPPTIIAAPPPPVIVAPPGGVVYRPAPPPPPPPPNKKVGINVTINR